MSKSYLDRRRISNSESVQQLWDAIKVIRCRKQHPDVESVAKYMLRTFNVKEEDVVKQLTYCVRDGLLIIVKKKFSKGAKAGTEAEGYKLPDFPERDKHDWYCWTCRIGGDVIPCTSCHRVYHAGCIKKPMEKTFQCSICQGIEEDTSMVGVKQSHVNKVLKMICYLLKEKYPKLIKSSETYQRSIIVGTVGAQVDIGKETWRLPFLIYKPCDLETISSQVRQSHYAKLSQFEADAHTIVHNIVIFHGVNSTLADMARQMARDCSTEIEKVRQCHTCYMATGGGKHGRDSRRKFYKPCRPPHELVYTKSKDSPYWPAKILEENDDRVEVRFFGGLHEKCVVDRDSCYPITTNVTALQNFKRTGSWNRACEELKRHQDFLKRFDEGFYESSATSSDSDESVKSRKATKILPKAAATPVPAKVVDGLVLTTNKSPLLKPLNSGNGLKKRGRPPGRTNSSPSTLIKKKKRRRDSSDDDDDLESSDSDLSDFGIPKSLMKRKPSKLNQKTPPQNSTLDGSSSAAESPKKGRGRPSKRPNTDDSPVKKKRGRPKKQPEEEKPGSVLNKKKDEDEEKVELRKSTRNTVPKKEPVEVEKNDLKTEKDDEDDDDDDEDEDDDDDDDEKSEGNPSRDDSSSLSSAPSATAPVLLPPSATGSTSSGSSSKKSPPILERAQNQKEEEIVSSSCMEPQVRCFGTQTSPRRGSDAKKDNSAKEISKLKEEIEKLKTTHETAVVQLKEAHGQEIAATKKKQWCYNCELEAIYHCCWNTAYCSIQCQQLHWQKEHKRVCRRKR